MSHTELLLGQISKLVNDEGSIIESCFDLPIICNDGSFLWSRLFIGACSSVIKDALVHLSYGDEPIVMLPDVPVSLVKSTLFASITRTDEVSEDEVSVGKSLFFDFKTNKKSPDSSSSLKCRYNGCSAQFSRKLHLERHVAGHAKTTPFVCEKCGKIFYHEDNLKLHHKYHEDLATVVPCPHCKTNLKGLRSLRSHIEAHHAPRVQCPFCDKSLKKKVLLKHIRSKHAKYEPKCNLSKTMDKVRIERASSKSPAKAQQEETDAVQDLIDGVQKRVQCDSCDKTFANVYIAKYHHEKVHLKRATEKTMSCSVCEKKFGGPPSRLARHMREVHAENRFECTICGHFFPVRASLERHSKTVHKPQKMDCPYCPVQVIHIVPHLTSSHGLSTNAARSLALELSGKSAARTNIPFKTNCSA